MILNSVMTLFCVISPNSVAFRDHYVKVVEDAPYILRVKCSPKNLVFSGISLRTIFAGHHSQRGRQREATPYR